MKIKICGLSRQEDIRMANRFLPDFVGFVFYEKSRRYVSPEKAAQLKAGLDRRIKTVGVFVNEDAAVIKRLCDRNVIDLIQLHGTENQEYIDSVKAACGKPVIKAVRVKNGADIIEADRLKCDFLLLDTYSENEYGGSGRAFDHSVIPPLSKPFFLAGGLNAQNLSAAAGTCKPYALDVSSGCETDGFKDESKLAQVVSLAHKIE